MDQISQILGEADKENYRILLTHNPLYAETYARWGADLTLAGHVHGGMIRLPRVGGVLSPERTLFPKYAGGQYDVLGSTLIANRGLGNGNYGIRLFNQPEISVITLTRGS